MATHLKSFSEILDEKVHVQSSSQPEDGGVSQANQDAQANSMGGGVEFSQFLNGLFEKMGGFQTHKTTGGYGPFARKREQPSEKAPGSSRLRGHSGNPEFAKRPDSARKPDLPPKPEPAAPIPRVKRNLTAVQVKALRLLKNFGESLDDYSTDGEIKSAYRRLAKKYHPDRFCGATPEARAKAEDHFKQIASAYGALIS